MTTMSDYSRRARLLLQPADSDDGVVLDLYDLDQTRLNDVILAVAEVCDVAEKGDGLYLTVRGRGGDFLLGLCSDDCGGVVVTEESMYIPPEGPWLPALWKGTYIDLTGFVIAYLAAGEWRAVQDSDGATSRLYADDECRSEGVRMARVAASGGGALAEGDRRVVASEMAGKHATVMMSMDANADGYAVPGIGIGRSLPEGGYETAMVELEPTAFEDLTQFYAMCGAVASGFLLLDAMGMLLWCRDEDEGDVYEDDEEDYDA